jgi:uncharacterized protein (TIGR03083 family)
MTSQQAPGLMAKDDIWPVITAQRLKVASLLEQLSPGEWQQPSLCTGWTVHDVAAHLTLQQLGPAGALGMLTRWRGSLDQTIHHAARRRAAAWLPGQIIAAIRATASSRRRNPGVTYLETLTDILVHGQDIAIPLGRHHDMPPQAAATAATRVLTMRWPPPLPAARTMTGFHLTATDITWSTGHGPHISGPIEAILLVSTGRLTALPRLSGEGTPTLTARLTPPQPE